MSKIEQTRPVPFESEGIYVVRPEISPSTFTLGSYWANELGDLIINANTMFTGSLTSDSAKNIYTIGLNYYNNSNNYQAVLVKYSNIGRVDQQHALVENVSSAVIGTGITLDEGGNTTVSLASGSGISYIAKLDPNGGIIWQNLFETYAQQSSFYLLDINSDSTGNTVALGTEVNLPCPWVGKFDSDGNAIWQNQLLIDTANTFNGVSFASAYVPTPVSSAVSPSGNVYISFSIHNQTLHACTQIQSTFTYTAKLSGTDGSVVWGKFVGSAINESNAANANNINATTIAVSNTENVYSVAADSSNGFIFPLIIKYSPDGTLIYKKYLSESTNPIVVPWSCTTDPDDNLYIACSEYDNPALAVVFKLDPTGNLVWQSQFHAANGFIDLQPFLNAFGHKEIQYIDNKKLCITGYTNQNVHGDIQYANAALVTAQIPNSNKLANFDDPVWSMKSTSYTIEDSSILSYDVPGVTPPKPGSEGVLFFWGGPNTALSTPSALSLNPGVILGSGPFTVEGWFYPLNLDNKPNAEGGPGANAFYFYLSTNSITTSNTIGANPTTFNWNEPVLTVNAWAHIAISRDANNNIQAFVNGVPSYDVYIDDNNYSDPAIGLGDDGTGKYRYKGYISDYRVVVGDCLYDPTLYEPEGSITVPTQPLQLVSNTQLLIQTTNALTSFIDQSNNNIISYGNPGMVWFRDDIIPFSSLIYQGTNYVNIHPTGPGAEGVASFLMSETTEFDSTIFRAR